MNRKKLLIIKHGFSETCDHRISPIVSYGDVFRCTSLLEDFRGYHVTWITARAAYELLMQNHLIDRLILADSPDELSPEEVPRHFDTVINLEKQQDWCRFTESLSADNRYGFRNWSAPGPDAFYPASAPAIEKALERDDYRPYQETMFQMVGRQWNGQRYVLGYRPRITPIYDVGLNYRVGPKWPVKAWPIDYWSALYRKLTQNNYAVCWQQSLNSIRHYIDWLASCKLIVTCDSLGLHLSIALKNKIVGLFGPTAPQEVYLYGQGIKLTPACDRRCIPCYQTRCDYEHPCMDYITVNMVLEAVDMLLKPSRTIHTDARDESTMAVADAVY